MSSDPKQTNHRFPSCPIKMSGFLDQGKGRWFLTLRHNLLHTQTIVLLLCPWQLCHDNSEMFELVLCTLNHNLKAAAFGVVLLFAW